MLIHLALGICNIDQRLRALRGVIECALVKQGFALGVADVEDGQVGVVLKVLHQCDLIIVVLDELSTLLMSFPNPTLCLTSLNHPLYRLITICILSIGKRTSVNLNIKRRGGHDGSLEHRPLLMREYVWIVDRLICLGETAVLEVLLVAARHSLLAGDVLNVAR